MTWLLARFLSLFNMFSSLFIVERGSQNDSALLEGSGRNFFQIDAAVAANL